LPHAGGVGRQIGVGGSSKGGRQCRGQRLGAFHQRRSSRQVRRRGGEPSLNGDHLQPLRTRDRIGLRPVPREHFDRRPPRSAVGSRGYQSRGGEMNEQIESLPVLPIKNSVLFPGLLMPLTAGRPSSVAAIDAALASEDKELLIVTQRDSSVESPTV